MVTHLVLVSWVVSAFSSSSKPPIFFSFFTRLFTAFSGQILSFLSSLFFRSRRRLITGADEWKTDDSIDIVPLVGDLGLSQHSRNSRPLRYTKTLYELSRLTVWNCTGANVLNETASVCEKITFTIKRIYFVRKINIMQLQPQLSKRLAQALIIVYDRITQEIVHRACILG